MHFISGIKSGGVEQMLVNYTTRLNKNSDYIQYIIYQHEPDKNSLKKLEEAGNICIQIPDKMHFPIRNIIWSIKLIRKYRPDIVHAHMSLLNFFPLLAARVLAVKHRISHSHISRDNVAPKFMIPVFKLLVRFSSNSYLACGTDAGTYLYGKKNFMVINNAVEIQKYKFSEEKRRKKRDLYGIGSDDLIFGNIGRLSPQKNQLFLIEIFSKIILNCNNAKLIIIGNGELEEQLKAKVSELGLNNNVTFTGSVIDTSEYYSMMDVFLLPSLYEGLPIVSIEAQIAGLKCLFSENIDKDVDVLSTTKLIPINQGVDLWIEEALKPDYRISRENIEQMDMYDIEKEWHKLDEYYLNLR